MRLGVGAALVGGRWMPGDVDIDREWGTIAAVGVQPAGASSLVAVPGFVDLQINGFGGVDFRDATVPDYLRVAEALAATGVTHFLPTLFSATVERFVDALQTLGNAIEEQARGGVVGARIGGAHLEGPFLSRAWAGAHDPERLIEPDLLALHRLIGAGPIAMMTIAPELAGAGQAIARLRHAGIAVAIGHTDVDAHGAHAAADLGASMITHCWNAHRRFTPRDPGPAAVALHRLAVGLICDGHHVADDTIRLTFQAAGDRVCIVTDAVAPTGTDASTWSVDGVAVRIADGRATLADGTLAGSTTTMDASVRHVISLGIDPAVAIGAASSSPRQVLGPHLSGAGPAGPVPPRPAPLGIRIATAGLRPGAPADITILDDTWHVVPRP